MPIEVEEVEQRLANPDGAWVALDDKVLEALFSMRSEYFPARHRLRTAVREGLSQ